MRGMGCVGYGWDVMCRNRIEYNERDGMCRVWMKLDGICRHCVGWDGMRGVIE